MQNLFSFKMEKVELTPLGCQGAHFVGYDKMNRDCVPKVCDNITL